MTQMQLLKRAIHHDIIEPELTPEHPECFTRKAARAIVIRQDKILLMYTARYNDYTLPGGGVDEGEDIIDALKRELEEETGAQNIRNIKPFGMYEEFRPHQNKKYYSHCSIMHMLSYCYTCEIDGELGESKLEDYEVVNGMQVRWVNIDLAIQHNLKTMENDNKYGLSIQRETFLLEQIKTSL